MKPLLMVPAFMLFSLAANADTLYVSSNGSGSACTAVAPCANLSLAVGAAASGDTVLCLSSPQPYYVIITKSITIDCSSARAPVRDAAYGTLETYAGVVINLSSNDKLQTVRLKGLSIDGGRQGFSSTDKFFASGIEIQAGLAVFVEDCVIENTRKQGIWDHRTTGQTRLFVKNTVISNITGPGIVAAASQSPASTVLDNVSLLNNGYGIATANGNNAVISRSTISGSTVAGISADGGSQLNLLNSVMSHNTANVNNYGTVRLKDNDIQFSNVAVQGAAPISLGANRFVGNGSLGVAPTPASGAPADVFN